MTARSPTMVTLPDTRIVECRWWNDGWTVKTVVTDSRQLSMIPAPAHDRVNGNDRADTTARTADIATNLQAGKEEMPRRLINSRTWTGQSITAVVAGRKHELRNETDDVPPSEVCTDRCSVKHQHCSEDNFAETAERRGGARLNLFIFHLGFVHPLQDVALHQCLPSSSICCFPIPDGSLLLCYVILPSSAWSSSRPLPSPWLPLCASPCLHLLER